jgi:5-methylthioadenosine/S-adenosylhomocysteine deaminase
MKERCDHIIKGGRIVCMDAGFRVLEDHFILVRDGLIQDILALDRLKDYKAQSVVDATGCLVIPALINAHSHLPMTYFRGLADDLPLDRWLSEYIWPLEAKLVDADFVYDASLHGAAEMLKNGICLSNDMYFHSDMIAKACSRAGMRVIVSTAVIAPDFAGDPALYEAKMLELEDFCRDLPLAECALAPHALYTCSEKLLKACAGYALKHDWRLHTHLSETRLELEDCLKAHGKRPLDYLADLGFLEARCMFAHGVWLSGEECRRLGASNSAVAICTDSNLKLASGFAPLKSMMEHGVRFAMGTDGVASNNNLDLLEELSTTAKLHKALNGDPLFLPAREAFAHVTIEAARALGMEDTLGSLEPGKAADLCLVDIQNLPSSPCYNPYSQLVYSMGSHQMRDVMVAGKFAVRDYQLVNLDESELIEQADEFMRKIQREMQK